MLKCSAVLIGANLNNVALITDGRYSGGMSRLDSEFRGETTDIPSASHGFIVGHVVPEAQVGGPIALVKGKHPIFQKSCFLELCPSRPRLC